MLDNPRTVSAELCSIVSRACGCSGVGTNSGALIAPPQGELHAKGEKLYMHAV